MDCLSLQDFPTSSRLIYVFLSQRRRFKGTLLDLEVETGIKEKTLYRSLNLLIKKNRVDVFLTESGKEKIFVPRSSIADKLSRFAAKLYFYLETAKEFIGTFPDLQKKLKMSKDSLKRAARELMSYKVLEVSCEDTMNNYTFKLNKMMNCYDYIH